MVIDGNGWSIASNMGRRNWYGSTGFPSEMLYAVPAAIWLSFAVSLRAALTWA